LQKVGNRGIYVGMYYNDKLKKADEGAFLVFLLGLAIIFPVMWGVYALILGAVIVSALLSALSA
jgi:hypothetical protein